MSTLETLSSDEQQSIIALPYKAGIWVSHSDDVDGEDDDLSEMKALEQTIVAIAKLHEGSAVLQAVARGILEQKDRWPQWEDECFHILSQAPDIMRMVQAKFGKGLAKEYRSMILEIATTVAQAASEFEGFDDIEENKESFWGGLVSKITGGIADMSEADSDHPMNVSAAENGAISQLSVALQLEG